MLLGILFIVIITSCLKLKCIMYGDAHYLWDWEEGGGYKYLSEIRENV